MPCVDPREAAHSKANPGDPTIASLCSNAKITPGPEAWKKYDVPKYMASILSVAGPRKNMYSPTNVDGALVIHSDVNPPGAKCTYTAKCDSIGCKDVRDSALGSTESIQRYLAYQGVVNLNNYLWNCYNALFKAGTIESLMSGDIVTTFFSNPKPDATWVQVVGGVAPLLGLASALLAPFTVPSAIFGAAGGIVGLVLGQGTSASLAPVVDARFTEESNIKAMVGRYLAALADGVGHAYDETIGRSTSIYGWTGVPKNNMGDQGVFGDGFFSNNNYIQDLTTNLYPNMVKIFTYKSINFAWKDSGAFIVFVPYGRDIMGPDGNIIHNFGANYCKTQLGDRGMVGKATNCDAGGGMAALVRAEGPSSGFLSQPQGYDKKFNVLPRLDFSVMGAIEGSVASWRKGDFNFDAGDPYKDALSKDTLSKDQLREIAQMPFEEKSPGMFNIPVCQTFDLRYFPYIDKKSEYRHCTACSAKPAVGGTAGSEKRFFDSVPEIVLRTMGVANSDYTQAYGSTPKCAKDLYTG